MAARATLNHFDVFSYHEQATLEALLDEPLSEQNPAKEPQGWFIRVLSHAFVNPYTAPPLVTNFVNLCKNTYSLVTLKRHNNGGNFCGHNPNEPRFVMQHHAYFAKQDIDDLGNKRRPQILYDIVERIKAYYHDPDIIPMLHIANNHKRKSDRKRRSETREAVVNLLSVMIMNMDLGSLRVGQPMVGGGFFNYGLEWLAKQAKISISRAKRAMSDLNDAMIISSYQYREMIDKDKKEYIAHNAARLFDNDFFDMLEIDLQKLGKARQIAYRKQKDKQAAYENEKTAKQQAVERLNMKRIMAHVDTERGKKLNTNNTPANEDQKKKNKRIHKKRTQIMLDLRSDPYYANNDAEFEREIKARFKELDLFFDHEKADW